MRASLTASLAIGLVALLIGTLLLWPKDADDTILVHAYITLEWTDLLPEADLEALLNPPEWLDEIEDGSEEDTIDSALLSRDETGRRFQQALASTTVIEAYEDRPVRLPGFVVPLDFNEQQQVTEFFLVPYFGACIHLPPPPPNQMVHVLYPSGLPLERLDDAVWVEGILISTITEHELGKAAYSMNGDAVRPYLDYP